MKFKSTLFVMVLSLIIFFTGCDLFKNENPVNLSDKIEYGELKLLISQSISSSGGKIVYTNPSDSLNGLAIDFPVGSYKELRSVEISIAPIKKNNFGSDFLPLTPIIRISNGGGYSDSIMTLEIPINLPDGYFPMAFYYDNETGELEGIPAGAVTSTKIYAGTMHFDGKNLSNGKTSSILATQNFADVLVAAVKLNELSGVYDSGFLPGVDDWEFTNWGSYINARGFCGGACLSETYYYYVRKIKGKQSRLYGLFDDVGNGTPDRMWQDNPKGIRLASMVQLDYGKNFDNKNQQLGWRDKFENIGLKKFSKDSLNYFSFLYALKITKKPQLTDIRTVQQTGHEMVVYKAGNGLLSIADPNYPGVTTRQIQFVNGNFKPYFSGTDAANLGTPYVTISYYAKSAYVDFAQVAQRWKEFDENTIGNSNFPYIEFQYKDEDDSWKAIKDTLSTNLDTLNIRVVCPTCPRTFNDKAININVLYENGDSIPKAIGPDNPVVSLLSKDFFNAKLGLLATGWPDHKAMSSYFVNFKWFTIKGTPNVELKISPDYINGSPDSTYKWEAVISNPPADARYEWDFGDGSQVIKKNNDKTVEHTYTKTGDFDIKLQLYDNKQNKLTAEAIGKVYISSDTINPKKTEGKILTKYSFYIPSDKVSTIANPLFEWDFGDKSQKYESSSYYAEHKFEKVGKYNITVKCFDMNNNKKLIKILIGEAVIGIEHLQRIQILVYNLVFQLENQNQKFNNDLSENMSLEKGQGNWKGLTFSGTNRNVEGSNIYTRNVSVTVDSAYTKVIDFMAEYTYEWSNVNGSFKETRRFKGANISKHVSLNNQFEVKGKNTCEYLNEAIWTIDHSENKTWQKTNGFSCVDNSMIQILFLEY
jgi:hypothetical protein